MLAGLFSPDWQSDSPEKRREWIAKADKSDEAKQTILTTLAEQDNDVLARHAAIDKLSSPLQVFTLSESHVDADTRQHALSALAELIGANSNITEQECRKTIQTTPEMELAICKYCPHADLRHELIEQLTEQQQAEIVADVAYTDSRQLIAGNLVSMESLALARKSLKGKDKSAEKIIKAKVDELNATAKQAAIDTQLAEELCTKMEYLAAHEKWRPEFKGQYLVCEQQWAAKTFSAEASVQDRFERAQAIVSVGVEQRNNIEEAQKLQQHCVAQLEASCHDLAKQTLAGALQKKLTYAATAKNIAESWQQQLEVYSPEASLNEQFEAAQQSLSNAINFFASIEGITDIGDRASVADKQGIIKKLESAMKTLSWPSHYPEFTAKAEIETLVSELRDSNKQDQSAQKVKLDKLHQRINRLLGKTNRGDLVVARRELDAVSKAAGHYSGKDKSALDERIEKAVAAVKKMGDWKDFATEPKYLELCDAMEELTKSKAHADKLAKSIGKLQQKWKDLGHCDSADKHWDRFKIAGDQAYEPCSIFFKQRRATRLDNLKKRDPLLAQMRALLEETAWDEEPDYKQVETQIRHIMNDWQKIKDVEPKQGQKQWLKLSKVKSAINAKLDVIYDANIEIKNQLIAQTLAMLETDIQEQSISKLQYLQKSWKQAGITRRKQDQAAWKKFNVASDSVYAKIKALRQDKRAEEDQQINAYRKIIKQIQSLAKNATTLAEADAEFEQLETEYQALPALPPSLPEKLIKGLETDYRRSSDAYTQARKRIKQATKNKALNALHEKANLCEQLEALGSQATSEQVQKLKTDMDAISISNKEIQQRLQQRVSTAAQDNRLEYGQARKQICVDLEILLDVDSPADDRALRMKVQLERLQTKGIGHSNTPLQDKLSKLVIDWLCLPGADAKQQKTLNQRFEALTETANKHSKN